MLVITYIPSICLPNDQLKFGGISIKMLLKFIFLVFSTLSYSFTNYPVLRGSRKKKLYVCEQYFPMFYLFFQSQHLSVWIFFYFSLPTHSIFEIFLISFKVFLCFLVLGIFFFQWMLDYTWYWNKSPGKKRISFYHNHLRFHTVIYFFSEFLWERSTYEITLFF